MTGKAGKSRTRFLAWVRDRWKGPDMSVCFYQNAQPIWQSFWSNLWLSRNKPQIAQQFWCPICSPCVPIGVYVGMFVHRGIKTLTCLGSQMGEGENTFVGKPIDLP
jgi:hypothetical protein